MTDILLDIWNLMFPRYCMLCNERLSKIEQCICINCLSELPTTNAHIQKGNTIEQMFWGLLPIRNATSFFYYTSDEIRHIVHQIKYHKHVFVAERLSEIMAKEICKSDFFDGIDIIIPVPIHWHRRMQRGYNQCDYIAKGISRATNIPIEPKAIKRIINNQSQTNMNSITRRQNVEGIFKLTNPDKIKGKHVLIVDDVITTGSTIKALGEELVKAGEVTISVISMAYSGQHLIV